MDCSSRSNSSVWEKFRAATLGRAIMGATTSQQSLMYLRVNVGMAASITAIKCLGRADKMSSLMNLSKVRRRVSRVRESTAKQSVPPLYPAPTTPAQAPYRSFSGSCIFAVAYVCISENRESSKSNCHLYACNYSVILHQAKVKRRAGRVAQSFHARSQTDCYSSSASFFPDYTYLLVLLSFAF